MAQVRDGRGAGCKPSIVGHGVQWGASTSIFCHLGTLGTTGGFRDGVVQDIGDVLGSKADVRWSVSLNVPRPAVVVQSNKAVIVLQIRLGAADCVQTLSQIR